MLPVLRMSLLGSVLVATFVLVAGSSWPAAKRMYVARLEPPVARGPLIDEADHPERKQFLVLAAVRRASELERLREPADSALREGDAPAAAEPRIVTLPAERDDAEQEEATNSIDQTKDGTIPVEIGAASSVELPIRPRENPAPMTGKPQTAAPSAASAQKPARKTSRAKPAPADKPTDAGFNPFTALFGGADAKKK